MKLTAILLLINITVAAATVNDGLYRSATDGGETHTLKDKNGKEVIVGPIFETEAEEVTLTSQDKENTLFVLEMVLPHDISIADMPLWLVLDGVARQLKGMRNISDGTNTTLQIIFHIRDYKTVAYAAKHYNIRSVSMQHPGHKLLTTFSPAKNKFILGEKVIITLTIKNVGNKPVTFWHGPRVQAMFKDPYDFNAYTYDFKPLPRIARRYHHQGVEIPITIEPNDSYTDEINISHWFNFNDTGLYRLLGTYYMQYLDQDEKNIPIWDDFACDQFMVRIVSDEDAK